MRLVMPDENGWFWHNSADNSMEPQRGKPEMKLSWPCMRSFFG
jgi:hypothetical protein